MLAFILAVTLLPCSVFSGQSLIVDAPIPGWQIYASAPGVAEFAPNPPYNVPTLRTPVSTVRPFVFDDTIGRVFVTNARTLAFCPPNSAPALYFPMVS